MKQIHNTTTKILSVDFDNTICRTKYTFPACGKPTFSTGLCGSTCVARRKQGWTIILNTLREPYKNLDDAVKFCIFNNIPIDYVNQNVPSEVEKWGDSRKIACDLQLDDRNIGLIGWLVEEIRMNILNFINALRETDKYIETIYTRGGCYRFHLLLKQMYPECEPMINMSKDHVATLYEERLYDINGVVQQEIWTPMTQGGYMGS